MAAQSRFDTIIRGGTIIDGTGASRLVGDLAIKDGVIASIAEHIGGSADEEIDATGMIVAPGVIDAHTHYDAQLHWDPYATNSGWHGTTTIGVGNCGFGFAPCHVEHRDRYMKMMETTEQVPVNAMRTALGWNWISFPEWMAHLTQLPKGVNVANYVPLNPLLIYVMGLEAAKTRAATPDEQARMKEELHRAMDAGAIGFAFSYQGNHNTHIDCDGTPMPTDIMNPADIYCLAEVLRERGEGSIQALVDTPGSRFGEIALEVARISGRPVLHNLTLVNDYLPTYHEEMLSFLDQAAEEGLEIYSQTLTMRGWNEFKPADWDMWNINPVWREFTFAGDVSAKIAKAADEGFRKRLRDGYSPEQLAAAGGPLETYVLNDAAGTRWASHVGKTIAQIMEAEHLSSATDLFMDIVVDTNAQADFLLPDAMSNDARKVAQVLLHPRTIPGTSDGGAHVKFWAGGQYSTDLIMWMVRENGLMTLEEIHYKLSGLPAKALGLHQRGCLLEGSAADIFIYDFDKLGFKRLKYDVVYDLPDGDWRRVCKPEGIERVIVNGQTTFTGGTQCSGQTPGRVVSSGGAQTDAMLMQNVAIAAE